MSDPFIAEIRIFAGNFAPRNWAFCNGQLLPIAQNTALFSLIGTTYGGDGRTTTALPNLQGRAPMHPGNGPGLTSRRLGERGGATTVALNEAQLGAHDHPWNATDEDAAEDDPTGRYVAVQRDDAFNSAADVDAGTSAIAPAGGGQPHDNVQPYLAINFVIALQGLFPSRELRTGLAADITIRPVVEADRDLLLRLYAGTRDDVELTDWTDDQKRSFIEMQFRAQATDYASRFPAATHSIIVADGVDVGRIWIERGHDEIRLLDITILPDHRNHRIGRVLLQRLITEAAGAGLPLRHSVYVTNEAALRFYRRLGFGVVEDHELYVLMEWAGTDPPPTD